MSGIIGSDAFDQIVLPHHAASAATWPAWLLAAGAAGDAGATATESVAACICRELRRQYAIESLPSRGPSDAARFTDTI